MLSTGPVIGGGDPDRTGVHPLKGIFYFDCADDDDGTGRAVSSIAVKRMKCTERSFGCSADPSAGLATSQCSLATIRYLGNKTTLRNKQLNINKLLLSVSLAPLLANGTA